MSDEQEALRLLHIDGIGGRALSRRSGIPRGSISNYRTGVKPMSKRMAVKFIAAFKELSEELRPRNNNEIEP